MELQRRIQLLHEQSGLPDDIQKKLDEVNASNERLSLLAAADIVMEYAAAFELIERPDDVFCRSCRVSGEKDALFVFPHKIDCLWYRSREWVLNSAHFVRRDQP